MTYSRDEMADEASVEYFLRDVLAFLDGVAAGVVRQALGEGLGSLSDKQWAVFKYEVLEPFAPEHCTGCNQTIPWEEKIIAADDRGLCSFCRQTHLKPD